MNPELVRNYFEKPQVVADYARAVREVGLWKSERILAQKYFSKTDKLAEFGCGAGRISINLRIDGYSSITATDISEGMVEAAKSIAESMGVSEFDCRVCDATKPMFDTESFDGAIFGFNGLMQIPLRENRRLAIANIWRVLKPYGVFVFTTHDREAPRNRHYWEAEKKQWRANAQQPVLDEFGDIVYSGDHGEIYIHSPDRAEITDDLERAGFEILEVDLRSSIADEPPSVIDFSDDCLMWAARKKTNIMKDPK